MHQLADDRFAQSDIQRQVCSAGFPNRMDAMAYTVSHVIHSGTSLSPWGGPTRDGIPAAGVQGNAQPQGYMVLARAVVADGNDVLLLDLGGVGAEGLKPGLGGSQGGDAHPADDVGQLHAGTGQGLDLGFGCMPARPSTAAREVRM